MSELEGQGNTQHTYDVGYRNVAVYASKYSNVQIKWVALKTVMAVVPVTLLGRLAAFVGFGFLSLRGEISVPTKVCPPPSTELHNALPSQIL
jgi:hypothetical protein